MQSDHETMAPDYQAIIQGKFPAVRICGAHARVDIRPGRLIFPGSFNPLHAGHREMAQIATKLTDRPVEFEISVCNVDKPDLTAAEVSSRAAQFAPDHILWLSGAATFVEKARLFPAATFVVGADTMKRISDPTYYGPDGSNFDLATRQLFNYDCRFLVFARKLKVTVLRLQDLELPPNLSQRCRGISAEEFCHDVSSTHLRAKG